MKRRRWRGKRRRRRAEEGRKLLKIERLAKSHLRIVYWNCGSLVVGGHTAEMLAGDADIVCLQETQHVSLKPTDFQAPVINKNGHGQLILVRKEISFRELDVTRWASENLHIIAIELMEQPVRNLVNVYAVCKSMKQQDWMRLDDLQKTLPGETVLCGDFNARGELWGNSVTNPQGVALEDALDECYLTCINDGSKTRMATRDGDSDSVIDLALTTLQIASSCKFRVLGNQGNDHLPYLSSALSLLEKPNGPEHSPTLKRETTLSLNSGQRRRQPSHNKEDAEHSRRGSLKKKKSSGKQRRMHVEGPRDKRRTNS